MNNGIAPPGRLHPPISAKLFLPGIDWKNEHRTLNIEHRTSNIEW